MQPKHETVAVQIEMNASRFKISGGKNTTEEVSVDIPVKYIRSILGLVAVMVDDQLPAMLEKTYIDADEEWSVIINGSLKSEKVFSGNWAPEAK